LVKTNDVESVTVSFAARENELRKLLDVATATFFTFSDIVTVTALPDVLQRTISLITPVVPAELEFGTV